MRLWRITDEELIARVRRSLRMIRTLGLVTLVIGIGYFVFSSYMSISIGMSLWKMLELFDEVTVTSERTEQVTSTAGFLWGILVGALLVGWFAAGVWIFGVGIGFLSEDSRKVRLLLTCWDRLNPPPGYNSPTEHTPPPQRPAEGGRSAAKPGVCCMLFRSYVVRLWRFPDDITDEELIARARRGLQRSRRVGLFLLVLGVAVVACARFQAQEMYVRTVNILESTDTATAANEEMDEATSTVGYAYGLLVGVLIIKGLLISSVGIICGLAILFGDLGIFRQDRLLLTCWDRLHPPPGPGAADAQATSP